MHSFKIFLFGLFLSCFSLSGFAGIIFQDPDTSSTKQDTVSPSFPGGEEALFDFLESNTHYPEECRNKGIEGSVIIRFQIDESGKVRNINLLKSSGNALLDETAISVIKLMPDWNSGRINGIPVSIEYNLPIKFTIKGKNRNPYPGGIFSYNCYFGKGRNYVIPLIETDSVKNSEKDFYVYHAFENIPLIKHQLKMVVTDTSGKEIYRSKYKFKPAYYDEYIYYTNFINTTLPAGLWTFKMFLNDSLLKEKDLFVLASDSILEMDFIGLSAGFQINRYKVAELNYILLGNTEKGSPFGIAFLLGGRA